MNMLLDDNALRRIYKPNDLYLPAVLYLGNDTSCTALDKKLLRDAEVANVQYMSHGKKAARYLAAHPAFLQDLVVVISHDLADMTGLQFCNLIRLHPGLIPLPLLLIVPSVNLREQLLTLGCTANELIARPYAVQTLRVTLQQLHQKQIKTNLLEYGETMAAAQDFDEALISQRTTIKRKDLNADDFFKIGMEYLQQEKWAAALQAFKEAVKDDTFKAEASLGMACAFNGKGKVLEAQKWMAQAAEAFVQANKWPQARSVYSKLLGLNAQARNPFLALARKQISRGEYEQATQTLSNGMSVLPPKEACQKMAALLATAKEPNKLLSLMQDTLAQDHADVAPIFNKALEKAVQNKREELVSYQEEVSKRRQEALSKRFNKPQSAEPKQTENPKQEVISPLPECTPNIDYQAELPELLALPGDVQRIDEVPNSPPSQESSPLFPRLYEIFHVAKMTWKLSRKS
ncbi:MAG: hypothetical protein IK079_01880 [Desulfovibrio sp.]|nr:hypothetical protein [Desulfovibrio sp.]